MEIIDFDLSQVYDDLENFKNLSIQKVLKKRTVSSQMLEFYGSENFEFREYYHRFLFNELPIMTNDTFEVLSNQHFFHNSHGDVLVFGLGFGWILYPILSSEKIKTITVVEKESVIIDFITPKVKKFDIENKLKVIKGDVYDYYKLDNSKYDYIYFDTYETPKDSISDKEKVEPLYLSNLKPGGVCHFWCWEIKDLIK